MVHALEERPGIRGDFSGSSVNHFAVLPHPRRFPWDTDRAAASTARATHFSYHHTHREYYHPACYVPRPFQPREALLSDGTLLLNDGSRLQLVTPTQRDLKGRLDVFDFESDFESDHAHESHFALDDENDWEERDDAFLYHTLAPDTEDEEGEEESGYDEEGEEESGYDEESEESGYDEESVYEYDDEEEIGSDGDRQPMPPAMGDSLFAESEEEFYSAREENDGERNEVAGHGAVPPVPTAATTSEANGVAGREGGLRARVTPPAEKPPVHLRVLLPTRTVFKAEPFMISSLQFWVRASSCSQRLRSRSEGEARTGDGSQN